MLDFNVVNASAIAILIVIFVKFVLPYFKKKENRLLRRNQIRPYAIWLCLQG